ncbi:MAG: FtsK/SpoIIIE domain-containing protein, partial [Actinomycetota bacterium]
PGEAGAVVEIDLEHDRLAVAYPAAGRTVERNAPDTLSPEHARTLATALAPIRDVGSPRAVGRLPGLVDLFDVLTAAPTPEALRAAWSQATELNAVIGASPSGTFRFDLRGDGPHCLIGGTTGAGKSELLQTTVASLATRYPPARLNFILIDYKGGTAFKDCVALPHVVGSVTDLDGSLASRALMSLDAEIKRRERVLRDAGARDLQEMERSGTKDTPPSLVLVIDEFATLVKELPEFVDGVVDIAQRGRALGINLILATQRPAGVISDRIRANTNLRIALRVGDDNDSIDVIGAPDAARIERSAPGRGFARIGHAELVAFQAAFGGRPAPLIETGAFATTLDLEGASATSPGAAETAGRTQLQEVVAAVIAAHGSDPAPFRPWLPPLPPVVPLSRVVGEARPTAPMIGVLDAPGEQRQSAYRVDLDEVGSMLVYGTSGAGKTSLLRTLAMSLASSARPDEMHIYGLDFSTHGLRVLEGLPHVGSIVTGDEEPKVRRLLTMIRGEIATRRELLADAGVTDLASYLRVSPVTVPRIVVMLDGYAGFSSTFEKIDLGELVDLLPRLIADGRQLGIHFVLTAERRGVVPGAIAGLVGTRIVLRMADDDEYAAAGADARSIRGTKLPAGRAFVAGGSLIQVAIATDDGTGADELGAIARAAKAMQDRYPGAGAPAVRLLPDTVEKATIPRSAQPLAATVGIDEDLTPVVADLGEAHFVVSGPYRSGRSTTLAAIADGIARSTSDVRLHLLAPRRSPLTELSIWTTSAQGTAACDERAAALGEELTSAEPDAAVIVVVDDLEELSDGPASDALARIARRGRDASVRILAAIENHALHRAFGGAATELRKDKNGLLLDPDLDVDGDLLGVRLPRRKAQPFPPGRGYLVRRGTFTLVQVAI